MSALGAKASSQRASQSYPPVQQSPFAGGASELAPTNSTIHELAPTKSTIPSWMAREISMGGQLEEIPFGFGPDETKQSQSFPILAFRSFSNIELVWVRCDEDHLKSPLLSVAPQMFKKVTVIEKCKSQQIPSGPNIEHISMPNYGTEGAGYARFILDRYSDLSPWTVFVHGWPEEHNGNLRSMFGSLDETKLMNLHDHTWLSINEYFVRGRTLKDNDVGRAMASMKKSLPELGDPHSDLDFYCCNQHVASVAAIRSRPIDFWARYYGLLGESHPGKTPSGKNFSLGGNNEMGCLYEHSFHRAYGEPWSGMKPDHVEVFKSLLREK